MNEVWETIHSLTDGQVSYDDFENFLKLVMPNVEDEDIDFEFYLNDINNDEFISTHEIDSVKNTEFLRLTVQKAQDIWSEIDIDGDGRLNFEEFNSIYDIFYSLGFAPRQGQEFDNELTMFNNLIERARNDDYYEDAEDIDDTFPVMYLIEYLGEGVYDAFVDLMSTE